MRSEELLLKKIFGDEPLYKSHTKGCGDCPMTGKEVLVTVYKRDREGEGYCYKLNVQDGMNDLVDACEQLIKDELLSRNLARLPIQSIIMQMGARLEEFFNERLGAITDEEFRDYERNKLVRVARMCDRENFEACVKAEQDALGTEEEPKLPEKANALTRLAAKEFARHEATKELYKLFSDENEKAQRLEKENEGLKSQLADVKRMRESDYKAKDRQIRDLTKEIKDLEHRLKEMEEINMFGADRRWE